MTDAHAGETRPARPAATAAVEQDIAKFSRGLLAQIDAVLARPTTPPSSATTDADESTLSLFRKAFTHPSFSHEQPPPQPPHYQRLEFLGDAVVGLVVARVLWERFPRKPEGKLARMRAALVNTETLAAVARSLGLGRLMRLGRGEARTGGRDRTSTLCDVFEALVGALFVARGWEGAQAFVLQQLGPSLDAVATGETPGLDAKSRLQELLQARGEDVPGYEVVDTAGPDHARIFTVVVSAAGRPLGEGRASSKQGAEQAAAADALTRLSASNDVTD